MKYSILLPIVLGSSVLAIPTVQRRSLVVRKADVQAITEVASSYVSRSHHKMPTVAPSTNQYEKRDGLTGRGRRVARRGGNGGNGGSYRDSRDGGNDDEDYDYNSDDYPEYDERIEQTVDWDKFDGYTDREDSENNLPNYYDTPGYYDQDQWNPGSSSDNTDNHTNPSGNDNLYPPSNNGNNHNSSENENTWTDSSNNGNNDSGSANESSNNAGYSNQAGGEPTSGTSSGWLPESDFKNQMLQAHNDARANHGANPVRWSADLVASSKQSLGDCPYDSEHHNQHGIGENKGINSKWNPYGWVMNNWVTKEYKNWDFATCRKLGGKSGHMTQVVWKETTEVGCVVKKCNKGYYYLCNYLPRGNMNYDDGEYAQMVGPPRDANKYAVED